MRKETRAAIQSLPIAAMLVTAAGLGSIPVGAVIVGPLNFNNSYALANDQMSCRNLGAPCVGYGYFGNTTGNCETVADGCDCE